VKDEWQSVPEWNLLKSKLPDFGGIPFKFRHRKFQSNIAENVIITVLCYVTPKNVMIRYQDPVVWIALIFRFYSFCVTYPLLFV
jgi:hypothetical protein